MDCTFSNPVDYQGNTPATDISSFAFNTAHCNITQFATPSASQQTATISAVSFTPEVNHAITDINFMLYMGIVFFLIALGMIVATMLLRRAT
jgi:hypothetical protein